MKTTFKAGDIVLFKHSNELPSFSVCILTSVNDKECTVISKSMYMYGQYNTYKDISIDRIRSISDVEIVRQEIEKAYDEAVKLKKSEIKSVTFDEKEKEKMKTYNDIKKRIMINCSKILDEYITEEEFVNRVKELGSLKKQLFSPEKLKCVSEIHKHNGGIKYECRKIMVAKEDAMNSISDRAIECFYDTIGRKARK